MLQESCHPYSSYEDHSMIQYGDISIAYIPIVSESVPLSWYRNRAKNPYFVIMFIWLLLGSVLSLAYESNLLANLVKMDLEKQPETFQVLNSNSSTFKLKFTKHTIYQFI